MLRMLLPGLALVLLAAPAWAWTETLQWTIDPGATTYRVEKSIDNGATWTLVTATVTTPTHAYTGMEPGLVLFRFANCNAQGCMPRPTAGGWHDESKQLPGSPVNVGVQ